MTVELIRGRHVYRLAHRRRPGTGEGVEVIGEVPTVGALENLLYAHARLGLADLGEACR